MNMKFLLYACVCASTATARCIRRLSSLSCSLNDRQMQAVLKIDGPLAVIAGPGSGKTNMVASRIASLILEHKVPAQHVMAVSFTNNSAKEMRERVGKLIGTEIEAVNSWSTRNSKPEIGTFHSHCIRMLSQEIGMTPFTARFVIYDDSNQLTLIKLVLKKLGLAPTKEDNDDDDEDDKKNNSKLDENDPKRIQNKINIAKCDALEPSYFLKSHPKFFEIYDQYQQDLYANNALDFGEIICMSYRLLRDHTSIRNKYQSLFRYIHVDEFQDINKAQYLWLLELAGKERGGNENICVVGDEDQSIYSWRGASAKNMMNFKKDYPSVHLIKFEQNYRSTKKILNAANHLIKNNKGRMEKTLWTENIEGENLIMSILETDHAEAEAVVAEVKRLMFLSQSKKGDLKHSDFSIIYRTNSQSLRFENILRREKIPYKVHKGLSFFDRAEVKDVLAYLRVILNPFDLINMKRIINNPKRKIGAATQLALEEYYLNLGPENRSDFLDIVEDASKGKILNFTPTVRKNIGDFSTMMNGLIEQQSKLKLTELLTLLLKETKYLDKLKEAKTEEADSRISNLSEFYNLVTDFETEELENNELVLRGTDLLPIFLEQCSLSSGADDKDKINEREDSGVSKLNLMTVHASKGNEYPVVFMVGMNEEIFPSKNKDVNLEEERRLCFVGMTRAKESLYLLAAKQRFVFGKTMSQTPSIFLLEIPRNLVSAKIMAHPETVFSPKRFTGRSRYDD